MAEQKLDCRVDYDQQSSKLLPHITQNVWNPVPYSYDCCFACDNIIFIIYLLVQWKLFTLTENGFCKSIYLFIFTQGLVGDEQFESLVRLVFTDTWEFPWTQRHHYSYFLRSTENQLFWHYCHLSIIYPFFWPIFLGIVLLL